MFGVLGRGDVSDHERGHHPDPERRRQRAEVEPDPGSQRPVAETRTSTEKVSVVGDTIAASAVSASSVLDPAQDVP